MDKPESPASAASPMSVATALSTDEEAIVASFTTVLEAEMARGRLEVEGIGARIVDGNTVGVAAHLSMALGGVKLAVARSDYEAARSVLFSPSALSDDDLPEVLAGASSPADASTTDAQAGRAGVALSVDDFAERALRASVLGLLFLPPLGHVWSLYLVGRHVWPQRAELGPRGRARATIAVVMDALAVGVAALVATRLF